MKHQTPGVRALRASLSFIIVLSMLLLPASGPAKAAGPAVLISQVYASGGNSGAVYNADYVELYNAGAEAVDLSGWSLQYASAAGTSWSVSPLGGILDPGHYFLIAEQEGTSGKAIPFIDLLPGSTFNLNASTGKLALVSSTTRLSGDCPSGETVVDFLGYGASANCFEGAGPAPALPNPAAANAWFRKGSPPADTNNNNSDFAYGAPSPRDYYTGFDRPPYVEATLPQHGAFQVDPAGNITITFSEAVTLAGGWLSIDCQKTGAHPAQVTGGPITYELNPTDDFASEEACTVQISAVQVTDLDAEAGTPMKTDARLILSTGLPKIHRIQGVQHRSDYEEVPISGLPGVVTAVYSYGFFMQDPIPDADPATSEAIFVYTDTTPLVLVGDQVEVNGTVIEFRPGSADHLTLTEIKSTLIKVGPGGNPPPSPQVIGLGGRPIPAFVIEDDSATGDVETSNTFDPTNDALDFFESLEGMRVQVNDAVVIGPTNSSGETAVLADNGLGAAARTLRGGLLYQAADPNPERLILGNDLLGSQMPKDSVGDRFPGAVTGVLDYRSSGYILEVVTLPAVIRGGLTRVTAASAGQYQLSVASLNLENLAPTDSTTKFNKLAALVVNNLKSPDLLAVEEIQDNTGSTNDGTVAANLTYAKFISAIQAAGGPGYQYIQIDPQNNTDGGATGGNIRVGVLYRTDRGLAFVPGVSGNATSANAIIVDGQGRPHLALNPGRILDNSSAIINPDNAFFDSRKPLAAEFSYNGQTLFVIANHFNSKSGDSPLFGRLQPPGRPSEAQRIKQALMVHDFVEDILEADPQARVVVLGDLNDYQFSPALDALKGAPPILHDLITDLPLAEQYTYVYEGNAQVLDHILLSKGLYDRQIMFDSVHVNAEFYDQVSDHDPQLVILDLSQKLYLPVLGTP